MRENAPQTQPQTQNYSNYQPNEELLRLRKRVTDLLKLGAATPETFAQSILQIWQETERHRQSSMEQAEDHLRKYHALVAQAQGFAMQSSILYSVINGYATIEERKAQEMADREAERRVEAETPAPPQTQEPVATPKRGRPRKQ